LAADLPTLDHRLRFSRFPQERRHLASSFLVASTPVFAELAPLKQARRQEWIFFQIANARQADCELHSEQVGFDGGWDRDPVEEVAGTIRAAAESRIRKSR
jgi:hypothetical protein